MYGGVSAMNVIEKEQMEMRRKLTKQIQKTMENYYASIKPEELEEIKNIIKGYTLCDNTNK